MRLANVSYGDVQAWVTELAEDHSPATVQKIHRVLSLVLDIAVKDGRLARNDTSGVNPPRVGRHEHRYLTDERVDDLATATGSPAEPNKHSSLDTRANETYRLVVLFLAYTGVRFGEMAALRVARLDLRRSRVGQHQDPPTPGFPSTYAASSRTTCVRRHPTRPTSARDTFGTSFSAAARAIGDPNWGRLQFTPAAQDLWQKVKDDEPLGKLGKGAITGKDPNGGKGSAAENGLCA